jgi:hypothetical protein
MDTAHATPNPTPFCSELSTNIARDRGMSDQGTTTRTQRHGEIRSIQPNLKRLTELQKR